MFQEIQLTNFKSFAGRSDPIPLAPVTILVGANASGKSNLLDAFRFLQGMGMGLTVSEVLVGKTVGGNRVFPGIRGGAAEVCWGGAEEFTISTKGQIRDLANRLGPEADSPECPFEHELACRVQGQPEVRSETLEVGGNLSFQLTPTTHGVQFRHSRSLLKDATDEAAVDARTRFGASHVLNLYSSLRFLELRPSAMREYSPLAADELGSQGENLSTILYRISGNDEQKERYVDWLSSLCAPPIADIRCIRTDADDVLVQVVEADGTKTPITARSLSDGTLRFMGVLAALFSAQPGTVFLVEEIENGLHPTRIHLLVELFEQFAESRNLQIIATTHSSQVLMGLSEKAKRDAILFARTEETPGTVTRRLRNLPYFEEVVKKTHIDHLFTTGWLERAL